MYYFNNEEVKILYKIIAELLNKEYRSDLNDIKEVKDGKFVVDRDPETGEYSIVFVWWNGFGINEETMTMREMGNDIKEYVMPATRRVRRKVREIQEEIEPDNDKYFFDMTSMHRFKEGQFENYI